MADRNKECSRTGEVFIGLAQHDQLVLSEQELVMCPAGFPADLRATKLEAEHLLEVLIADSQSRGSR